MFKKSTWLLVLLVAALALGTSLSLVSAQDIKELTILWAEWDPADYLQQIGNDYEAATGIKVNVVQEPWGSFLDRMAAEWAARGTSYDMVVGDSQWIGQAVEQGHYLDLTDFLVSNGIKDTVTPATLQYYGEYPAGSGKYYAYPTEGDAVGWAYRKDLFEDEKNKTDFQAKYGYELKPPETWAQLRDIAEFLTRPDDGIYGVGVYTQKDYDGMVMGFQNVFFSWGADWRGPNNEILGVVNSDKAVEALDFYKGLYQFAPPGTNNAFYAEMNDVFISGQAAMIMNYFAFFPALTNPGVNPYADVTGFFAGPKGPDGERYVSLGGQGLSIISYISPERQDASKEFIKWFASEDVQTRWAAVGGYTCNSKVLQSEKFLTNTPYNAAFADSMTFVKDFWNIPQYGELLEPAQTYLSAFVVGNEGTAKETMDKIAQQQNDAMVEAGLLPG